MEFPSKKDVGINLTYGLDGFGTLSPSLLNNLEDQDSFFRLPRKRTTTQAQLQILPKSFRIHYKGNEIQSQQDKLYGLFPLAMRKSLNKRLQIETINSNFYVPEGVMKDVSNSKDYIEPKKFFDPCVNDLIKIVDLSDSKKHLKKLVLISTGGPLGNTVTFTTLDTKHDPSSRSTAFPFGSARSLRFSYKVVHLVSASNEDDYQMIGILTQNSVHILKLTYPLSYLDIEPIFKFEKDHLAGFEFSHMDFSQSDKRFAVVDVKGNYAVFVKKSIESGIKYVRLKWRFKTIYDPVELSNFKKIFWSREYKSMFIMTRSAIHLAEHDRLECKVIANAWSKLLDFVRPTSSLEKIGFLLTTKELIIVDEENGFRRLLAWKHSLNERDMSLNLKVISIPCESMSSNSMNYLCLISSRLNLFTYALEFAVKNGNPMVLNSPYMISQHPSQPIQSFDLASVDNSGSVFISYQLLEDHEISSLVLIRNENSSFEIPINTGNCSIPILNDAFIRDKKLYNYKDFYEFLINWHNDGNDSTESNKETQVEYDEMQRYADSLSNALNEFLSTADQLYTFLIDNGNSDDSIHNLGELESMVFQLMEFYFELENGLKFSCSSDVWLTSNFKIVNATDHEDFEEFTHIDGFLKKLAPLNGRLTKLVGNISKDVGLSLLTVSKKSLSTEQLQERIESIHSKLDTDKSSLLDDFSEDEHADNPGTADTNSYSHSNSHVDSYLDKSQTQIPTVSLSQNVKSQPKPRNKRLLGSFSQLSSSQVVFSDQKQTNSQDKHISESQPILGRTQESQDTGSRALFSQVVGGPHGSNVRKRKKRKTGFL